MLKPIYPNIVLAKWKLSKFVFWPVAIACHKKLIKLDSVFFLSFFYETKFKKKVPHKSTSWQVSLPIKVYCAYSEKLTNTLYRYQPDLHIYVIENNYMFNKYITIIYTVIREKGFSYICTCIYVQIQLLMSAC